MEGTQEKEERRRDLAIRVPHCCDRHSDFYGAVGCEIFQRSIISHKMSFYKSVLKRENVILILPEQNDLSLSYVPITACFSDIFF